MLKFAAIAALASMVATVSAARAHDLFWQSTPDGFVLMEGHLPGHEHEGEAARPVDPGRVVLLLVGAADRTTPDRVTWRPAAVAGSAVLPGKVDLLLAVVDWGWWSRTANGTCNAHPDSLTGVLLSWRSRESTKHVIAWPRGAECPGGRALEITPVEDPFCPGRGDKLTVRVTLDGAPVAGAVVTYGDRVRGTTGADGTLRLKLREPGLQVIRASLRRPLAGREAAEDVRTATLTFELGGGR